MHHRLQLVTLVVDDYEKALAFYCGVLGFELIEDRYEPEQDKRWIIVRPSGGGTGFVLGRATTDSQRAAIGNQTGGRVAFFLHTDDFARDFDKLSAANITFVREPRTEVYGTVAVFRDLYGNLWDLIEPSKDNPAR